MPKNNRGDWIIPLKKDLKKAIKNVLHMLRNVTKKYEPNEERNSRWTKTQNELLRWKIKDLKWKTYWWDWKHIRHYRKTISKPEDIIMKSNKNEAWEKKMLKRNY